MEFYNLLIKKAKEDGIEKIAVGGVILNSNNEVLLLTRKLNDFMGGIDEFPSGNLEENEGLYEGLLREIKEETNLDVSKVYNYINSFDYLSGSGKKARQYNFSLNADLNNEIKLSEHDFYKWWSIEDAINNSKITKEVKHTLEIYCFNLRS